MKFTQVHEDANQALARRERNEGKPTLTVTDELYNAIKDQLGPERAQYMTTLRGTVIFNRIDWMVESGYCTVTLLPGPYLLRTAEDREGNRTSQLWRVDM